MSSRPRSSRGAHHAHGGEALDDVSVSINSVSATDDPSNTGVLDGDDLDDVPFPQQEHDLSQSSGGEGGGEQDRVAHSCKRPRADFPWSYTHDWEGGDPPRARGKRQCTICKKWFLSGTNGQGWKVHLSIQHRITNKAQTDERPRQQTINKLASSSACDPQV